jgi:hypothetical protein
MQNLILKKPKALYWTLHSRHKMRQYGLSEARVRRILHSPKRIEKGIATRTAACMQTVTGPKRSYELWVMVQDEKSRRKVISAWRYPGVTKPGEPVLMELMSVEYKEYAKLKENHQHSVQKKVVKTKWFRPKKPERVPANALIIKSKKL